jgi:hypothetical protein
MKSGKLLSSCDVPQKDCELLKMIRYKYRQYKSKDQNQLDLDAILWFISFTCQYILALLVGLIFIDHMNVQRTPGPSVYNNLLVTFDLDGTAIITFFEHIPDWACETERNRDDTTTCFCAYITNSARWNPITLNILKLSLHHYTLKRLTDRQTDKLCNCHTRESSPALHSLKRRNPCSL